MTLPSGFDKDTDALPIRAGARVLGAILKAGESVDYALGAQRHGYLVPAVGAVEVDGTGSTHAIAPPSRTPPSSRSQRSLIQSWSWSTPNKG